VAGNGRLAGRCALVTGASSGIGEATARLLSAEGAAVGLVARRHQELERVARGLRSATVAPADVADHAAVVRAIDQVEAELGPIDIAVNCAGVIGPTPLSELTPEVWQRTIAVNLSGTFYVGREAGTRMRHRGSGQIVNVASDLAFAALPGYTDYSASKAGVVGLTRGLAVELAPTVLVNAVAPGPVDTPMMDYELSMDPDPQGARETIVRRIPLLRIATPDEIARAILFLVTDATYATGAVLSVDGGTTVLGRLHGDARRAPRLPQS
jgi:NAD(P)-dependent dehydrogenase (short-subunit alcohol dehydrogenase family)